MEQDLERLSQLLKQGPREVPLSDHYDRRIQLAQAEQLQGIRKALEEGNRLRTIELNAIGLPAREQFAGQREIL